MLCAGYARLAWTVVALAGVHRVRWWLPLLAVGLLLGLIALTMYIGAMLLRT